MSKSIGKLLGAGSCPININEQVIQNYLAKFNQPTANNLSTPIANNNQPPQPLAYNQMLANGMRAQNESAFVQYDLDKQIAQLHQSLPNNPILQQQYTQMLANLLSQQINQPAAPVAPSPQPPQPVSQAQPMSQPNPWASVQNSLSNSSINPPNTTEYKITPYNVSSISSFNQLPKLKRAYTYSISKIIPVKKIIYKKYQNPYGHLSQNSLNLNQYKYKPTIIHYTSTSSIMKPKTYTIRSYNPNISWNSIALNRTNVTLPTINEYVFMKKPKIILPTKKPIQIIKPVFLQPKATIPNSGVLNTKIVPNLSVIKIEPNISIVPKVTLINQNMNNFSINRFEKYPMDNINGRRRVIL